MNHVTRPHYGVLGGAFLLVAMLLALALPGMADAARRIPASGADVSPPVTTDNLSACSGAVFLLTFTAVDGESGVAATYYNIDGADWTAGASVKIVLARPHKLAGLAAGAHTVNYYSMDARGNVESTKSVSFTL